MTLVIAKNYFDGLHHWPNCPDCHPHNYLKNVHRHRFHVRTTFAVDGEDRVIEIFEAETAVAEAVRRRYAAMDDGLVLFGPASCEMIARTICEEVHAASCEVTEDGEGGAVYYTDNGSAVRHVGE